MVCRTLYVVGGNNMFLLYFSAILCLGPAKRDLPTFFPPLYIQRTCRIGFRCQNYITFHANPSIVLARRVCTPRSEFEAEWEVENCLTVSNGARHVKRKKVSEERGEEVLLVI